MDLKTKSKSAGCVPFNLSPSHCRFKDWSQIVPQTVWLSIIPNVWNHSVSGIFLAVEIFSNDFVFNLNANLTRPIFLDFLVDKLEEALYTDSAGCFLVKLD